MTQTRSAKVELAWADGRHSFRLAIGELRELQEKCNAGPMFILNRLIGGTWLVDDIRETIRLGLIGGGLGPEAARNLVERYVDPGPVMENENLQTAKAILLAACVGAEEEGVGDDKKKDDQTQTQTTHSPTENLGSPASTAPDAQSDTTPAPSTA